jgi:drug/metabolite transporter (DMT)-like permease
MLVLRFTMAIALLVGTLRLTAPDKLKADRRGLLIATFAGLENGMGVLCFFWALTRLEASIATMIFTLYPLLVLGLLALGGEKLTYRHLVRIILGLIGIFLIIGPAGGIDWLGLLLLGVTICCISVELVLIQWYLQPYDSRTVTLYVLSGILTTITGYWWWQGTAWQNPSGSAWLLILLLAVVCTYFAWWAMFSGMRQIGSGQVAMLVPLETLLTVLWSFMLLGERFSLWQYVGAGLILLSTSLAANRLRWARWPPRWRVWSKL